MSVFEKAIALEESERSEGRAVYRGAVHPAFQNMIGPYGGWSVAVLANALMKAAPDDLELISITTDFMNAVPDGPFSIEVTCDRAGRGTQFWQASLISDAGKGVSNRATAVLARRRNTVEWTEGERPDAPDPMDCPRVEFVGWMKPVQIRHAINPPFQGNGDTRSAAWVRMEEGRPLDVPALVALADTPAPRLFHVLGHPDPIATISMTVYIHASADDLAAVGGDFMLVDTNSARGGRGFFDQHARIWSRDGRLIATTQQVVWYRAKQKEVQHA